MAAKKAPARPGRRRPTTRAWGPGRADWTHQALCSGRDTEVFFPEGDQPVIVAKSICQRCPVRADCLAHALRTDERYGIWGGLTEHERDLLREGIAGHTPRVGGPGDDDGPVAA